MLIAFSYMTTLWTDIIKSYTSPYGQSFLKHVLERGQVKIIHCMIHIVGSMHRSRHSCCKYCIVFLVLFNTGGLCGQVVVIIDSWFTNLTPLAVGSSPNTLGGGFVFRYLYQVLVFLDISDQNGYSFSGLFVIRARTFLTN